MDFDRDAIWVAERLEDGDHLVGHSYGGVIALLAAAEAGNRLASLTVIEPPCTRVALDDPGVAAFARGGAELYAKGAHLEPEAFLRMFLGAVGSDFDPPSPLPPALEQGVRALATERGPWEADIPLERLAALGLPTLVVSGAHHPAFDAICDVLERPSPPSVSCCRASATTRSSTRTSTRRCSTSSRGHAHRRPRRADRAGLGDSMLRRGS